MTYCSARFLTICFCVVLSWEYLAGQCDDYIVRGSQIFHANHIRTVINTGGDMFWDLQNGHFLAPFTGSKTPTTLFAAAIWMGAYDDTGNLKVAAQTYRSSTRQEYHPGPLNPDGSQFSEHCGSWDTIWSVARFEILLHLNDYLNNGIVDDPMPSIFGWPGAGNPYFEEINGFSLPTFGAYAPFYDQDGDGVYRPDRGDFPLPERLSAEAIPDQITWHVFNDARLHVNTNGDRLSVEVQQTCYAYFCKDDPLLNTTIFMDFRITNRSFSFLDSLYFAMWVDADIGCYTDDAIGSVPKLNAFIGYNIDSLDGTNGIICDQGVPTYGANPPALSGSFISTEMSSYTYYNNGSVGNFPQGMTDPRQGLPMEWYRLMSGRWRDGTPVCIGDNGYDPGPGCVSSPYAFSGNPNDSSSWAMSNLGLPAADRRTIASTHIGRLEPGEGKRISMSFSLHLDPARDHLGNVALLYEELPLIQETYHSGFYGCHTSITPCPEDCVWPGDANHDGIANHHDLLFLGLTHGRGGTQRNAPLSWAPHDADPWDETFNSGLNIKHADMNGDGMMSFAEDTDILRLHYGLTHSGYHEVLVCQEGNELIVQGGFARVNPTNFNTATTIWLNADRIDSLYGIAFTVLFDTSYFFGIAAIGPFTPFAPALQNTLSDYRHRPGEVDYATVRGDGENMSINENLRLLQLLFRINRNNDIPGQHDTTELCLANIRGILADGTEIPMGSNTIQFIFLDPTVSTVSPTEKHPDVVVYPNPSSGTMHIEVPESLMHTEYVLHSYTGGRISSGRLQSQLTTWKLESGMYVLTIYGEQGPVVARFVVIEE